MNRVAVFITEIWNSTWREVSKYFSINKVSSPKPESASDFASLMALSSSDSCRTIRIPFPPPPALAFSKTGKPISMALALMVASLAVSLITWNGGTSGATAWFSWHRFWNPSLQSLADADRPRWCLRRCSALQIPYAPIKNHSPDGWHWHRFF